MDSLIELFSNPKQAQIVIQSIANYMTYIYPGIISIYCKNFLEAKSTKVTQSLLVKSFSISFLYNLVLNVICNNENKIKYNIIIIIIAFLCPFVYFKIKYSKFLEKLYKHLGIRTCMLSIPFELLKTTEEKYTCFKIYLNDNATIYIGYLSQYEYEENKERFVILVGYKKYIIEENKEKLVVDNCAGQSDQKVFIKYSEIKVIEKIAENIATDTIYNIKQCE